MKNLLTILITLAFTSFAFAQSVIIKDSEETPNILLQINDEGTAGSITMPDAGAVSGTTKLYNNGGNLFWGTSQLGTTGSAGGWTDSGTDVYLSTAGDKVGIGTLSAPTAKLDIELSGAGNWQRGIRLLNPDLTSGDQLLITLGAFDNPRNVGNIYFNYQGDGSSRNRLSLGFYDVNDVLNIIADGNVGIGTSIPADKLHIAGGDIRLDNYWLLGWGGDGNAVHGSSNENYLRFRTNSTDKVIINSDGNVGIGILSPAWKLDVLSNLIPVNGTGPATAQLSHANATRVVLDADPTGSIVYADVEGFYGALYYDSDYSTTQSYLSGVHGDLLLQGSGNIGPQMLAGLWGTVTYAGSGSSIKTIMGVRGENTVNSGSGVNIASLYAARPELNGGSTTNNYGVYIEDMSDNVGPGVPAINSYGIYSVGNITSYFQGNIGIGTTTPGGKLDVNGAIYQRGGVLHADYVFEDDYELESIQDHSNFMWTEKHLKSIPKAQIDENGLEIVEVGSHRKGIVEELEKAHIYIAQLEERLSKLESLLIK